MRGNRRTAIKDVPAQPFNVQPRPQDVQAVNALYTAGRLADAEAQALLLIEEFPRAIDVYNVLGAVQEGLGKRELAIASYVQAITIKPDFAEGHYNLGVILSKHGLLEQATKSYRLATVADPDFYSAYYNLGNALKDLARFEEAVASYVQALRISPRSVDALSGFARALQHLSITDGGADLKSLIIHCFESFEIGSYMVRLASQEILSASLQKFLETDAVSAQDLVDLDPSTGTLLLAHLRYTLIADADLEIVLSRVRSSLLELGTERGHGACVSESVLRLMEALAYQGFLNEYVWHVTDDENSILDELETEIAEAIQCGVAPGEFDLYLLAAYRPLYAIECIRRWTLEHPGNADAGLNDFLEYVILNLESERKIGEQMERLTSIDDDVSVSVRSQYEENPYPRWDSLTVDKPRPFIGRILKDIAPHKPGLEPASPAPDVLIAGCGTGSHPISCGLSYLDSNILAVDLSRTSLAFAKRKAEELKVRNIRFAQADILKLGELEGRFDVIECGGVLHHMADPGAGLTILLERLKPGGFLRLGLYSDIARQNIVRLRQIVSDKSFEATLKGIREFRRYVRENKNPDAETFRRSNDFYSVSGLRDLIFHVQEHRFTIPQISKLLDDHKLDFLGFVFANPLVKSGYLTLFPDDPDCLNLENWHQFEQDIPHTFKKMYQFWCRKGL